MLFENFSANVDAVRNTICYIPRCDGFDSLVLEIQGVELAPCNAKIFRSYYETVLGHSPLWFEYGLREGSQFLLDNELSSHLSTTISIETVYKALHLGDGRQPLLANKEFQLKYRNGVRPAELYAADFEADPQILCFEYDPGFGPTVRAGVARMGKQDDNFWRISSGRN